MDSKHLPLRWGRLALAALCCAGVTANLFGAPRAGFAQGNHTAPVTFPVTATPNSVGQLDYVLITGNTVVDGTTRDATQKVKLTVSLPNGKGMVSVLVPAAQADGLFRACFNQTNIVGTYTINVTSPGGGAKGSTRFVVEAGYGPPDEDAKLGGIAAEFEGQIEKLADSLPPSPARENMQGKLDSLRARLTDSLKQVQAFNTTLKRLYALFAAYPQARGTFDPVLHALDSWAEDAKQLEARIGDEMRASSPGSVRCDDVSRIARDLQDIADLLSAIETPMKEVAAFEKNYKALTGFGLEDTMGCVQVPTDVHHGQPDPKFADALKGLDPADVPAKYFDATLQLAKDTLAAGSQRLFSAYCDQFKGPFSAHMHADFSEHGEIWWSYDIYAVGTLTVRYEKGGAAGQKLRLTGEFDGNITHFTVHENALDVLFPKLKRTSFYWHNDAVPTVPQHFRLPVSGSLSSDEMIIALSSAAGETIDNENNVALCSYVLTSPYLLALLVQKFPLPYKDMQWVASKALADQSASFFVGFDKQHNQSYVKRAFHHTRRNPGAVSTYDLQVKACNPSCATGT